MTKAPARATSCTSPGEIGRQTRRPFASTRAWSFVVRPPGFADLHSFLGTRGMLIYAHDRTVDHLHLAVVGFKRNQYPLCATDGSGCTPWCKAHIVREHCATEQYPEDAVENSPIELRLHATPAFRHDGSMRLHSKSVRS